MPDNTSCQDTCVFVWTGERQIWPCYEKLLVLAKETDCLPEAQELWETQKLILADSDELLGALQVQRPGGYQSIMIPEDFNSCIILICQRAMSLLDDGYLKIDASVSDDAVRPILDRIARRRSRQLYLCRAIAAKRRVTLPTAPTVPTPPPVTPGPPPVTPGRVEYVVQPGDTMYLIAQRFGVSLDELIRANPQIANPDIIYPGEIVYIPRRVYPGPGRQAGPGPRRYVVREGDTISLIAQRFGLSVSELLAFNPQITDPSHLSPGQVLLIPTTGAVG